MFLVTSNLPVNQAVLSETPSNHKIQVLTVRRTNPRRETAAATK
jgi:hypothetical protein